MAAGDEKGAQGKAAKWVSVSVSRSAIAKRAFVPPMSATMARGAPWSAQRLPEAGSKSLARSMLTSKGKSVSAGALSSGWTRPIASMPPRVKTSMVSGPVGSTTSMARSKAKTLVPGRWVPRRVIVSGRRPRKSSPPRCRPAGPTSGSGTGKRTAPSASLTSSSRRPFCTTRPLTMFIDGEPMKPATKRSSASS